MRLSPNYFGLLLLDLAMYDELSIHGCEPGMKCNERRWKQSVVGQTIQVWQAENTSALNASG